MRGFEKIWDISQPVSPASGVFPGDVPFRARWTFERSRGDSCNVAAIESSPHVGTHADAPLHFSDDGADIGSVELGAYLGPCVVVEGPREGWIRSEDVAGLDLRATPRVLYKTHRRTDTSFPGRFVSLSEAAAVALGEAGAALVGLDTPSMDPPDSKGLAAHRALGRAGVAILENLSLGEVEPGRYFLVALPLRWMGVDAAPVRAVLCR